MSPTSLSVKKAALSDPSAYPVTVTCKRLPSPKVWANGDIKSDYTGQTFLHTRPTVLTVIPMVIPKPVKRRPYIVNMWLVAMERDHGCESAFRARSMKPKTPLIAV